jgi:hypothetical protein
VRERFNPIFFQLLLQVAVVLEVVLIHYFVREMRADAVPVQMRAQVPAGGSVSVSPGGSLFDIDWAVRACCE